MGYQLAKTEAEKLLHQWTRQYDVFAPMRMEGEGCFSDTDIIRYGKVTKLDDIVWDQKSDYSFKEVLLAINETLFYFTEDQTTVPKGPEKDILIFLRSCDLHGVKRLDEIYLRNGFEDFYYGRVRERAKFILMGCPKTCASGFCVSMGTNRCENYDAYLKLDGEWAYLDVRDEELEGFLKCQAGGAEEKPASGRISAAAQLIVTPDFAEENKEKVTLPKHLSNESFTKEIWKEYGSRCIGCGRCNFVCPTCTCFTMQDIFYRDNPKVGERRRVWASCQVDGYTDMAGGHGYRKSQGDRMRFKVMHKIYDYEKRFGYPMCVGCGRCDDVCPEYISYSNCVNRLAKEESEV
ncbi:MAG: anaerobic sulfite reductase subunit AsrA [Lachnospiraceae bacterium]|nr:anaerobic sulfite reductase subunit AsrA [Lachnospiraceae bacterium]